MCISTCESRRFLLAARVDMQAGVHNRPRLDTKPRLIASSKEEMKFLYK